MNQAEIELASEALDVLEGLGAPGEDTTKLREWLMDQSSALVQQ